MGQRHAHEHVMARDSKLNVKIIVQPTPTPSNTCDTLNGYDNDDTTVVTPDTSRSSQATDQAMAETNTTSDSSHHFANKAASKIPTPK